jgi:hypothetical protein
MDALLPALRPTLDLRLGGGRIGRRDKGDRDDAAAVGGDYLFVFPYHAGIGAELVAEIVVGGVKLTHSSLSRTGLPDGIGLDV